MSEKPIAVYALCSPTITDLETTIKAHIPDVQRIFIEAKFFEQEEAPKAFVWLS